MILEVILLLNLMITVMGDSFDRVFKDAQHATHTSKADLVVQLEHRYRILNRGKNVMSKGCKTPRPWVHVLQPKEIQKDATMQEHVSRMVDKTEKSLEKKFKDRLNRLETEALSKLQQRIDRRLDRIENMLQVITNDGDEMEEEKYHFQKERSERSTASRLLNFIT